jgi:hypothetical protein
MLIKPILSVVYNRNDIILFLLLILQTKKMVDCRLFVFFLAVTLFVSVLYAERARNDNLQDEEIDRVNYESDGMDYLNLIKNILFLYLKKLLKISNVF